MFLKKFAKRGVLSAMHVVSLRPKLKARILIILNRHPQFKSRIKAWVASGYQAEIIARRKHFSGVTLGNWPLPPSQALIDLLNSNEIKPLLGSRLDLSDQRLAAIRQSYYEELARERNRLHAFKLYD